MIENTGRRRKQLSELTSSAWKGITALIQRCISDGSFGARFPKTCLDIGSESTPYGTDEDLFWGVLEGDIPNLTEGSSVLYRSDPPPLADVMDMIEFCWNSVGEPIQGDYHDYYSHYHLRFDEYAGAAEFRESINRIFQRNGLAYTLTYEGQIERLLPIEIGTALRRSAFQTGDGELDEMLAAARQKILSPSQNERYESLKELWDAWERIKTIDCRDKKRGIEKLLDQVAGSNDSLFRKKLECEAKQLTKIGNEFLIRHSETTQEPLENPDHVDYLFYRLFALINLILRSRE